MNVVEIVTTMFDSLLMLVVAYVGITSKDRENLGTSLMILIILVMNLFCIWGV